MDNEPMNMPGLRRMPKILNDLEGAISRALPGIGAGVKADTPRTFDVPGTVPDIAVPQQPMQQQPRKLTDFENAVLWETRNLANLLIEKNAKYGNSALNPIRVFSDAHPIEQILVRIDDKLSRIRNGHISEGEDTIQDLMGYLVLLRIAQNGVK